MQDIFDLQKNIHELIDGIQRGNLVSARKPDDIPVFNRAMVEEFGRAQRQRSRAAGRR